MKTGAQAVLAPLVLSSVILTGHAFAPAASPSLLSLHRSRWWPFTTTTTVRPSQTLARPQEAPVTPSVFASSPPACDFASLPWSKSITGEGKESLLYMPFVEYQMQHIRELGGACEVPMQPHLAYRRGNKHLAHIGSACFENEDFRRIRMTYVDAGKNAQVFNSVWYPRLDCDAPLLGIDLLCFAGGHKLLAVVDYQPLSHDDAYKQRYHEHLVPIRSRYPSLRETVSNRYYEDTRWFSEQMLFGKFQHEGQVWSDLMPAFREYLTSYTAMVKKSRREGPRANEAYVGEKHREYDRYNMERDPAGKLFDTYFGKEWSHQYMCDFLFDTVEEGGASVGR